jgi:hypothetical protein
MSRSIEIVFADKTDIHKVRNFGEELSRNVETKAGWGHLPMAEVDRATTQLHIGNVHARNIKRVSAFIETLLKKHYLDHCVNVFDIHSVE